MRRLVAACALVAGLLAGCAGVAQQAPGTLKLKGSLALPESVDLPAGSVAIVEVRDTSQPEGRGVAAERRIDLRGGLAAIPFELAVDPSKLQNGKPYAVRGGVGVGGRPSWITDSVPLAARSGVVDLGALAMKPVRLGAFPTRFQCGDVVMTLDFLGERARLTVGQTELEMRHARTADGARFEAVNDPTTWFWNRGRAGMLSLKGRQYPDCRLIEASGAQLQREDPRTDRRARGA